MDSEEIAEFIYVVFCGFISIALIISAILVSRFIYYNIIDYLKPYFFQNWFGQFCEGSIYITILSIVLSILFTVAMGDVIKEIRDKKIKDND